MALLGGKLNAGHGVVQRHLAFGQHHDLIHGPIHGHIAVELAALLVLEAPNQAGVAVGFETLALLGREGLAANLVGNDQFFLGQFHFKRSRAVGLAVEHHLALEFHRLLASLARDLHGQQVGFLATQQLLQLPAAR